MAISLHDVTVQSYLQALGGVAGFLDRGLAHCMDNGLNPEEIVETRLFPDMLPFRFQVQSVAHHSRGAIEGVRAGLFAPPPAIPPLGYAELQKMVAEAKAMLESVTPEEINGLEGRDMAFALGEHRLAFTVENFLLSFSLPNFYFHAATAYDILRMKGVPLGKRDYMGKMRMKPR
jgi:hypothetical protein